MILEIDPHSDEPIYRQLRQQIIIGIAKGELRPGEQLPTVRQIADELGVNSMTVSKGYQLLKEEGYLLADRRKGTVVAELPVTQTKEKESALTLLLAELVLSGMDKQQLDKLIKQILNDFRKDELQ
ncbi:GntR family transcriptional regulator [Enterococcus florum]|uniref:GntR family transcriptional regulator n=1 Tax=Enterococcus florum TaxID=2480627 RepID=A0A4P5PB71_9ENTE|nr:GntR family transcriptional regulator [Enterococcus florum]GCF93531.1 GntR family transcriptional regulator [Enterococcus florum]